MGAAIAKSYGIDVFQALTGFKNLCGKIPDVYAKGYVHYFNGDHNTTFSLQDATLNYEYDNQEDNRNPRKICNESIFYDSPWIIRVMLEGSNRIFFSSDLSGAEKYRTVYDSTQEGSAAYGCDKETPEVLLSGNHEAIRKWRLREAIRLTMERRPDLIDEERMTKEEKKIYQELLSK